MKTTIITAQIKRSIAATANKYMTRPIVFQRGMNALPTITSQIIIPKTGPSKASAAMIPAIFPAEALTQNSRES